MPIYPPLVKNKVSVLRSQGYTYQEICATLKIRIPKSTLNYWCRGTILPSTYKAKLTTIFKQSIKCAQAKNKQILSNRLNALRSKNHYLIERVDHDTALLILATLYWCEGGKYPSSTSLKFGNSDPKMILLFITLLRRCFSIDDQKFRLGIQCRADQNTSKLIEFWTNLTHIKSNQVYPPTFDPRSIGKPTLKSNYLGVCVIYYFDANIQCELQFLGEYLGTDEAISMMHF